MFSYPQPITPVDHLEPVPRRIRGVVGGEVVFDTIAAQYHWEWPFYPQYLIPAADVDTAFCRDGHRDEVSGRTVTVLQLLVDGTRRPDAAHRYERSSVEGLEGFVRFQWDALDAWYEEDERVFVHPRSPYVRVDALRSSRLVRVECDGIVLAESAATVMVFETGLPTRHYFDPTAVDLSQLTPSETETSCPYKGRTTGYWHARIGGVTIPDLAWSYGFPTRQLSPIAGLIAFYDELVDTWVDGVAQPRPVTHQR